MGSNIPFALALSGDEIVLTADLSGCLSKSPMWPCASSPLPTPEPNLSGPSLDLSQSPRPPSSWQAEQALISCLPLRISQWYQIKYQCYGFHTQFHEILTCIIYQKVLICKVIQSLYVRKQMRSKTKIF